MKKISLLTAIVFSLLLPSLLCAQQQYKLPPKEVIEIVDAPATPRASVNHNGTLLLLSERESMPSIETMAQPMLRLAGTRLTPKYNSRRQTTFITGLVLKNLKDGRSRPVDLPKGSKLGSPKWSFDDQWLVFPRYTDEGIELWAYEIAKGKAKALTTPGVNASLGSGFRWMPDNRHLLVNMCPEGRGEAPPPPAAPKGPTVQETSGKKATVWTFQDLLKNAYDEKLFTYYATSQLVEIDVETGGIRKIGSPAIFLSASFSPGGNYILVQKIKEPFSYAVPYRSFAHTVEVWNRNGDCVKILADLPIADEVPVRGVPTGPRSVSWRPLHPATLVWAEALDGGDPEKKVPHRDRIMTLAAPFQGAPAEVLKVEHRYWGLSWLEEGMALLSEYNWKKRWATTHLIPFDDPSKEGKKIFDRSVQDRYNNPGRPVSKTTEKGESIVLQDGKNIFLSGRGSSPKGDRPFLDRMNLDTLEKERLFQSKEKSYETFAGFAFASQKGIITNYQSKTEPPNYFLVNLETKERKALTRFKDPAPQLTGLKKELIKYKRDDGIDLSGTLYLPPDYKEGVRLPLIMWAYPMEYNDPNLAGQVRGSTHRFTFLRGTSQLFFVTQGYAVLDSAKMPIVGDPKTMNDTFIEQIVASAKAAINKLDAMGIIDPKRVAVGGHSYGAFMTANLLAHCDLFAAGIARSGAYNRTLTPFGFQSERRTLWQAPEIYFKVSPFMHAHKINEPLLLIHGEADNNSGTFPIQSKRLFHALKGHGAVARLVMLPHESHGYRARESVLHVLAEMFEWADKYVKNR